MDARPRETDCNCDGVMAGTPSRAVSWLRKRKPQSSQKGDWPNWGVLHSGHMEEGLESLDAMSGLSCVT